MNRTASKRLFQLLSESGKRQPWLGNRVHDSSGLVVFLYATLELVPIYARESGLSQAADTTLHFALKQISSRSSLSLTMNITIVRRRRSWTIPAKLLIPPTRYRVDSAHENHDARCPALLLVSISVMLAQHTQPPHPGQYQPTFRFGRPFLTARCTRWRTNRSRWGPIAR